MNIDDFIRSGGASIWQFAPRGTSATHIWELTSIFPKGEFFEEVVKNIWLGASTLICAMFFLEITRLFLKDEIKREWKIAIFKLLFVLALFASYETICMMPANLADEAMQMIADDASCTEAFFTFMGTAEQGMIATFNPTGAVGTAFANLSPTNLLQGLAYTLFYLVWWILPLCISGVIGALFLLGPYCLAFFCFKPLSGIAGMWAKLYGGSFFAFFLLCLAYNVILYSKTFQAASATNSMNDPYTTLAFSITGLLVALGMPSMAIRLLGGRLSFVPGRQ